jgi:aminodeoxyfutalosine deaminase
MADVDSLIAALPKAELHVHMQGAASVETVLGLSQKYPDVGMPQGAESMRAYYRFTDFPSFIALYVATARLVRTGDDVHALAVGLARDLAAANVRYAETTVTADSHLQVGIAPDELADALSRGRADARNRYGVELAYVYDIDGEFGPPSGERLLSWIEAYRPDGSIGFGLGGPENGVQRSDYADLFRRARDLGLHSVPHAGETVGPHEVWSAIDELGAERIGHGIAAARDERLMTVLIDRGIALEICPTSNVCTGAVTSLAAHPFPVLRAAGVALTVNTDDPGMFGTDLNREYRIAHDVFGVDAAGLADLARESVRASFAPAASKAGILAEIDEVASTHLGGS